METIFDGRWKLVSAAGMEELAFELGYDASKRKEILENMAIEFEWSIVGEGRYAQRLIFNGVKYVHQFENDVEIDIVEFDGRTAKSTTLIDGKKIIHRRVFPDGKVMTDVRVFENDKMITTTVGNVIGTKEFIRILN